MSRISAKTLKVIQGHLDTTEVRNTERTLLILLLNINIVAVHSNMQALNGNKKRREGKRSENSHLGVGWRTVPGSCRPRERNTVSLGSSDPPLQNRLSPGEDFHVNWPQATCPNPVGQREVIWSQASTAPLAGCSYNHTHKPGSCTPLPRGLQEVKSVGREGNDKPQCF